MEHFDNKEKGGGLEEAPAQMRCHFLPTVFLVYLFTNANVLKFV